MVHVVWSVFVPVVSSPAVRMNAAFIRLRIELFQYSSYDLEVVGYGRHIRERNEGE